MIIVDNTGLAHCLLNEPTKSIQRGIKSGKSMDVRIVERYILLAFCLLGIGIGILTGQGVDAAAKFCALLWPIAGVAGFFLFRTLFRSYDVIMAWCTNRENMVTLEEEEVRRQISLMVLLNATSQIVDRTRPVLSFTALVK